jgi:peptide/nickel transport system substrate-binding protein
MVASLKRHLVVVLVAGLLSAALAQTTLRIGLAEDPDILDPALARTYVGRIVFASLCDKLFDITTSAAIVPQLATGYTVSDDGLTVTIDLRDDVVFHDGTRMDAEAVRYSLDRAKNLPGSNRASEIAQLESVTVVDDDTVQLHLSQPFAPLIAQLADRAGMIVSPAAAEALGEDFGNAPVCAGPFKFVERVAQDRIVLEKFADYYAADQVHIDRVVFVPIPDTSVRLANLQSGDLDMIERPAPTDLGIMRADPNIVVPSVPSLGYQGITINLANPEPRSDPLASDVRVREAFELAIDRNVINDVVFGGEFVPGNQPVPPTSPWYVADMPIPQRDPERARALLTEAGYDRVSFELMVANNPESVRLGEVIQALAGEVGFDITLRATEFATALDLQEQGEYDAFQVGWSGRLDPDGNIHQYHTCAGSLNETGYCDPEVDRLLDAARTASTTEERYELYKQALERYLLNRNIIYLYHTTLFFPHRTNVQGFEAYPDGLIRLQGVTLAQR